MQKLTLGAYVQKRNGVPMSAAGSFRNNMRRSFGAASFAAFWRSWNPIFGFYLARFIFIPLKGLLPPSLALLLTFAFSGLLHDIVTMLVSADIRLLFTPWFVLMACWLLLSERLKLQYGALPWWGRMLLNLLQIMTTFALVWPYRIGAA
jgi:D-alanyl-lipoteichoic acid acyltransferase DltB (MBOAT superfamily)